MAQVVTMCHSLLINDGPTAHWISPEMLVNLVVEGREATALADSGSQVNTMTPTNARHYQFPVLPLEELVGHPLNLIGLGGRYTSPLGFVILWVRVVEIAGYDEDVVFLIMPNESEFSRHVPLVLHALQDHQCDKRLKLTGCLSLGQQPKLRAC